LLPVTPDYPVLLLVCDKTRQKIQSCNSEIFSWRKMAFSRGTYAPPGRNWKQRRPCRLKLEVIEKGRFVQEGAGLKNNYATQIVLLPVAPCYYFQAPYYYLLFILCILNKNKKNLYEYISIYKKREFVFYASLRHNQAAERFGELCPIQVPPVSKFYLPDMLRAVLVSGRSWNRVVGENARRPDKAGGFYGVFVSRSISGFTTGNKRNIRRIAGLCFQGSIRPPGRQRRSGGYSGLMLRLRNLGKM
jgi:hypothetical protein